MKELVKEIKGIISERTDAEIFPVINKKGFSSVKISRANFQEINTNGFHGRTAFIDGGNSEIIGSSDYSIQKIRVASIIFENNKKKEILKEDYYAIIKFDNNKVIAKTIPENIKLEFDLNDESLKEGRSTIKISKIGNFIRRIAELELAKKSCEKADFIILDGSLEVKFTHEKQYLNSLYELADKQNKCVAALSKTNSLIASNNRAVPTILRNMKKGSWVYHPIAKIESEEFPADMMFVKLNDKSKHVFRLDIHNNSKPLIENLLSNLFENSKDPVFPGYPYGLIEADRNARISNREKKYLQTKIMVELGEEWNEVEKTITTSNAHEILDNIS